MRAQIYGLQGINGFRKDDADAFDCGTDLPDKRQYFHRWGKSSENGWPFRKAWDFCLKILRFWIHTLGFQNLHQLASIKRLVNDDHLREVLREVGLNPDDRRPYRKYSLGMKQRLGIAAAYMENPDLVILDEPTNALDTDGIELVKKILQAQKARGALVLISCHDLEILRHMSDEIFVLEDGRVKAHLFAPFEEEAS